MSKVIRHYEVSAVESDGVVVQDADLRVPLSEKTIDGDVSRPAEFSIEADESAVVYDATVDGYDFALLKWSLPEDGFCEVWYGVQAPTSTTNPVAAGTLRWFQYSQSCVRPAGFDTPLCRWHDTLATHTGDTGGLPTAMDHAGTVDGRIYKVVLKNTGDDTVVVKRTLVN